MRNIEKTWYLLFYHSLRFVFIYFILFCYDAGELTQGFQHAKQAFYLNFFITAKSN